MNDQAEQMNLFDTGEEYRAKYAVNLKKSLPLSISMGTGERQRSLGRCRRD
jgi:hypothetical protein